MRRTRRGAARALTVAVLPAFLLLTACADLPPEYNPIEWGKSAARGVGSLFGDEPGETAPPVEPPPAEGRPYPNLATVPRPPKIEPREVREAELARLQADHEAAATFDERLRGTGEVPVASPPPPTISAAPVPPPAPAPSSAPSAPAPPAIAAPVATPPQATPRATVVQAAPPAATLLRRQGAVAFARDGARLSEVGERALFSAAALARTNNGAVRLIPAQVGRQTVPPELARARQDAIVQALDRAGLARERVRIDDAGGRRVDVYDLYVEY